MPPSIDKNASSILGIEDLTELAHRIKSAVEKGSKEILTVSEEQVYEVSWEIQATLGMLEENLIPPLLT